MLADSLLRRLASEFLGSAMLVSAVVGSGIMAERLADGSIALALLANSMATGAALIALILVLTPISRAHFNPIVTMSAAMRSEISGREALFYSLAQVSGGLAGVIVANLMFDVAPIAPSGRVRTGTGIWLGEVVASFGLVGLIIGASRSRRVLEVAIVVAAYITAAYWFTSSTSFANPAMTIARTLTDTFTGIRPADAPAFLVAQLIGGTLATGFFTWLIPRK